MRRIQPLLAVAILIVWSMPAQAATSSSAGFAPHWSVGANFGMSFVNPEISPSSTVLAWPADGGATAFQPGIRVGYTKGTNPSEFYVDTGLAYITGGNSSSTTFELTGNYQYNFKSQKPKSLAPYATGGLGLVSSSFEAGAVNFGATSLIYGLGVGLRHRISDGHGTIRGELRFDHLTEGNDGTVVVIESSNIIGIKLGFDIWMK